MGDKFQLPLYSLCNHLYNTGDKEFVDKFSSKRAGGKMANIFSSQKFLAIQYINPYICLSARN